MEKEAVPAPLSADLAGSRLGFCLLMYYDFEICV
jgi:hypothetical protein